MNNYTEHTEEEVRSHQWTKESFKGRGEKQYDILDLLKSMTEMDLKYDLQRIALDTKVELLSEKEIVSESGKFMIEHTFSVKYKWREYTGRSTGNVHIFTLKYEGDVPTYENYKKGYEFVQTLISDAVKRVGCYCCYGNGPDMSEDTDTKRKEIRFFVDFDFRMEDYE